MVDLKNCMCRLRVWLGLARIDNAPTHPGAEGPHPRYMVIWRVVHRRAEGLEKRPPGLPTFVRYL